MWNRNSCLVLFFLAFSIPWQAQEIWRSPLNDLSYILIEKQLSTTGSHTAPTMDSTDEELFEPVPAAVLESLGAFVVDYPSFTTSFIPRASTEGAMIAARSLGLSASLTTVRTVHLPWHEFEPGDSVDRNRKDFIAAIKSKPIPGLYLAQFAYPIRVEWITQLELCKVEPIAYFQHRTYLLRAPTPAAILECGVSSYLSWLGYWFTTDRAHPSIFKQENSEGYWLQFIPGTDLSLKALALPEDTRVEQIYESDQEPAAYLHVTSSLDQLAAIIDSDPHLLSVSGYAKGALSDERQGQIVAGNHNGVSVSAPGYRNWLNSRGLLTSSNQQIVAVIDLGYDDGLHPGNHHPDLENPDRLDGIQGYLVHPRDFEGGGHGTLVAGIIAGDGTAGFGSGAVDGQGFLFGSGIAPKSKIFAAVPQNLESPTQLQTLLTSSRNYTGGGDRALIVNNSWNLRSSTSTSVYLPVNKYEILARFFDSRTLDGNVQLAGAQPTTIIFSAGNYRQNCNGLTWDSVSSPATAKNVITVGATESYRPSATGPPLDCNGCAESAVNYLGRPPDHEANHVSRVATFSGRGMYFGAWPSTPLNLTRVKPDLVAPGVRVYSTVPHTFSLYDGRDDDKVAACTKYHPGGVGHQYHSFGTGTSFAAPVVSGVAALKRKWFLDRGTNASPSLLKAALVATADTLGGYAGNDHRPSPTYGWGRVNLNRLTDARKRFYISDTSSLAVATGQSRSWTRTIDSGASPTYIVLAWSDPPTAVDGNSQAALVNDLALVVNGGTWRGNYFNENITGTDNGYSYQFTLGVGANDTINNVESIFIPPNVYASGQSITITVTGMNVPQGPQMFGLYAYNIQ